MPRHTRGCRNCVHRHILCDELYPVCANCQARNLACNGPLGEFRFIHTMGYSKPVKRTKKATSKPFSQSRQSPYLAVSKSHLPTPYDASIHSSGSDKYLCFLLATAGSQEQIWLQYCMQDPRTYPTANLAIEAFSIANFAKVHKQEQLLVPAAQKYAKTILALQHALTDTRRHDFDSLAAVTAMNRYEILVCTAKRAWSQHVGGVSRIIEGMGPSLFQSHPYKAVLDTNRFRIMHEAYTRRKPTFLRQKHWQITRTPASEAEACLHELQDLYGMLSEIAAQADLLDLDDTVNFQQRRELSDTVDNLLHDLNAWREKWKAARGFVPCRVPNDVKDTFYADADGLVFAESLSYPTLEDAVGMNMCTAIKLIALEWQRKLPQSSWWLELADQKMADVPAARSMAYEICQGLHLHFESSNIVSNVYFFMFTAITAHKAFHRNSREMRWLLAMLTRAADLTGFELPRSWIACYQNQEEF